MDPNLRELLNDLASQGIRVEHVATDDACPVCLERTDQTYEPALAPDIPVEGCQNDVCRCAYVPVA